MVTTGRLVATIVCHVRLTRSRSYENFPLADRFPRMVCCFVSIRLARAHVTFVMKEGDGEGHALLAQIEALARDLHERSLLAFKV
jgi:hypothetical protein